MCCKMKKSVIPILPLLLLLALPAGNGLWGQIENDRSSSPYFQVNCADEKTGQLPLMATSARVNIAGVIADVQVTQRYRNAGEKPIEAIYVFPASTRAAVYGMKMTIGSRVVTAKSADKEKARHQYEQALEDGRRKPLKGSLTRPPNSVSNTSCLRLPMIALPCKPISATPATTATTPPSMT